MSFERKPNIFVDILTFFSLSIILKKSNFDLTVTITPKAGFLGTLASFLKRIPIRNQYQYLIKFQLNLLAATGYPKETANKKKSHFHCDIIQFSI